MRLMYDSVSANAIPANATMVAGYVDGRFAWTAANWARFPNAVKVRISAVGHVLAEVFDVEDGCIWPPAKVVPLVVAARKAGIDPTVYVNERNDWGPTKAAFDAAGVPHPHWWVANYDGNDEYIPASAVARQFAHPPNSAGHTDPARPGQLTVAGHYDLSVVRDYWPGIDSRASGGGGGAGDEMQADERNALMSTYAAIYYKGGSQGDQSIIERLVECQLLERGNSRKLDELLGRELLDVDESELALALAPLLRGLPDEKLDQLTELVSQKTNDERDRRERERLEVQP